MKSLLQLSFIFLLVGFMASCKSDAKKPTTNTPATSTTTTSTSGKGEVYKITPGAKMNWGGRKVGGGHVGTIDISGGEFLVDKNTITGGSFTIDMNSIVCTDLDEKSGKAKLEGHLKGPDFFDVKKYPTAKFKITKVVAVKNNPNLTHNIFGDLTLKDVTKNIGFNTKLAVSDGNLAAIVPNFKIDRTVFNVKYGSSKFFDNLKDKVIRDEIDLGIKAIAAKK